MARPRKGPWRRKADNCWYTTEKGGKKPVKLAEADATYEQAFDVFCQYHGTTGKADGQPGPLVTVSFLIDEFLEWCEENRAERTYEWYHPLCQHK